MKERAKNRDRQREEKGKIERKRGKETCIERKIFVSEENQVDFYFMLMASACIKMVPH